MCKRRESWYFCRTVKTRRVEFLRNKYGHELLVDVAWVHDMPSFILDQPHALSFY